MRRRARRSTRPLGRMHRFARNPGGLTYWQRQSPLGKFVISIIVWIPIAGFVIGFLFSRIVPSDVGITVGCIFGALYGLAWVVLVEKGIAESDRDTDEIRRVAASKLAPTPWLRVPLMWWVGLMFGYGAATWGYPWLYNGAFGSPAESVETVSRFSSGGRGTCAHPEIGKSIFANSPHSLCVDEHMAVGSKLRIVGRSSVLGMNVEEIYLIHDAP